MIGQLDMHALERLCAEVEGADMAGADGEGARTGATLQPAQVCVEVSSDSSTALLTRLRDDPDFSMRRLVDLTAIDRLDRADWTGPRFEVRYRLRSPESRGRLNVCVRVEESAATLDSVVGLWPAAEWLEREVFDLFGIVFRGHPDLRRILLEKDFDGAPLRRDFPLQPDLALPGLPGLPGLQGKGET